MTFFCAISAKKYWISLYSGKIDRQIELDAGVSGEEERRVEHLVHFKIKA